MLVLLLNDKAINLRETPLFMPSSEPAPLKRNGSLESHGLHPLAEYYVLVEENHVLGWQDQEDAYTRLI